MSLVTLIPVRYYNDQDVYHFTNDNRPLQDLSTNDSLLQAGIDILSASISAGVSQKSFSSGADFTPNVTSSLTLPSAPSNEASTWVFFDGQYQDDSKYSLNGNIVDFSTPIPTGVSTIEIKWGNNVTGAAGANVVTNGDTDFNVPVYKDYVVNFAQPITNDRSVNLPVGASNGYKVRVIRSVNATGAYNVNVISSLGIIKSISTSASWADFAFDGANWIQTAAGTL